LLISIDCSTGETIMPNAIVTSSLCAAFLYAAATAPVIAEDQAAKVTPLMAKELSGIAGKEGTMITVEYAPGGASPQHRHNAHVFVYVLEGSLVMQVAGGQPVTVGPGQTFYESPSDIHAISKNASDTKPAKFVVFMVKDKGAPPTVPAK
jgi:quercetin dioxygenase-like cupin family protein